MPDYQLYCFAQSGNAYRAALMLNLIGADWQPIYVDFFRGGETRTPKYRVEINEMVITRARRGKDDARAERCHEKQNRRQRSPVPDDRDEKHRDQKEPKKRPIIMKRFVQKV